MTKTNKKGVRAQKKKNDTRKVAKGVVADWRGRLDSGARAWLNLLGDPCNAPMVPGCFPGMTSGMLYRTRTTVSPGSSAVDGVCYFNPGGSATGYYPLQYCSVNTTGTSPGTKYGATIDGLPAGNRRRCVAACLKLRYTGSELNRAGIVGTMLSNDIPFLDGVPAGTAGAMYTIPTILSSANTTYRLGETAHEARWVPMNDDSLYVTDGLAAAGNAVAILVVGAPAGSFYWELTAVWEIIPDSSTGVVPPERAPTSSNTLNDVLRAIGNVGAWATDPANQRGVYNLVGGVVGVGRALSRAAPAVAMLM